MRYGPKGSIEISLENVDNLLGIIDGNATIEENASLIAELRQHVSNYRAHLAEFPNLLELLESCGLEDAKNKVRVESYHAESMFVTFPCWHHGKPENVHIQVIPKDDFIRLFTRTPAPLTTYSKFKELLKSENVKLEGI